MNSPSLSRRRLVRLYALYNKGYSVGRLAEIFGLPWYPIWNGFRRHGFKRRKANIVPKWASLRFEAVHVPRFLSEQEVEAIRREFLKTPIGTIGVRGYGEVTVNAIYSDYVRHGESIAALARRWKRSAGAMAQVLATRGLRSPDPERRARSMAMQRVEGSGCFAKMKRAAPAEISAFIARAKKAAIPPELRWEFRTCPMAKRADFIRRIRARLRSPDDRPETPFSRNVRPFDYATPEARAIKDKLNAGLTSQEAICRIDLSSQGVIYKGELWFCLARNGYAKRGAWTPDKGRPSLHRVMEGK